MPVFNPNEPQNGEVVDADLLRDQFTEGGDFGRAASTR